MWIWLDEFVTLLNDLTVICELQPLIATSLYQFYLLYKLRSSITHTEYWPIQTEREYVIDSRLFCMRNKSKIWNKICSYDASFPWRWNLNIYWPDYVRQFHCLVRIKIDFFITKKCDQRNIKTCEEVYFNTRIMHILYSYNTCNTYCIITMLAEYICVTNKCKFFYFLKWNEYHEYILFSFSCVWYSFLRIFSCIYCSRQMLLSVHLLNKHFLKYQYIFNNKSLFVDTNKYIM